MSKKVFFEACERNKGPILEVFKKVFKDKFSNKCPISVLEIAGGTGQHAVFFSTEMPNLIWQPSDIDEKYIESMKSYIEQAHLTNVKAPIILDITNCNTSKPELDEEYDVLAAINLIHISPWECSEGLFTLAGKLLSTEGILVMYGPFALHGEITPDSNVRFNKSLKAQNPKWGLRDVDDLEKEAKKNGLVLDAMFNMPANNKTLVWLKQNE